MPGTTRRWDAEAPRPCLGSESLATSVPVGAATETRTCVEGGSSRAREALDSLPAQELLSCALELRNFKLLGISDEASKALLRGY